MDDCSFPVELYFSGRKLRDMDIFSKSDPYLKFSLQQTFHGVLTQAGRTETANNTVNPNWGKKVAVQYYF